MGLTLRRASQLCGLFVFLPVLLHCAEEQSPSGGGGSAGEGGTAGSGGSAGEGGGTAGSGGSAGEGGIAGSGGSAGEGGTAGDGAGGMGGSGPNLCGNGTIDGNEACDGNDFGDKTCATFGLSGGTLICNPFCGVVVSACTPKESCGDSADNDQDGLFDCEDTEDCGDALACTDPCAAVGAVGVPTFEFGNFTGKPDVLDGSCSLANSPEVLLGVTAAIDGDLAISVFASPDVVVSVRTVCSDAGSEIACRNQQGANNSENLSFPATAGTTYYVVVESLGSSFDTFYNISVDQPFPESFCNGQFDDDFDGFVDCDDPNNCQGSFECQPGSGEVGSNCFQNTNCAAQDGDPICLDFNQGFNNGYCSEFCDGPGDCPNAGVCKDLNISFHGVCFKSCATFADCPAGTDCVDDGGGQLICDKPPELNCQDYADNDFDSFTDCADPSACASSPSCASGPLAAGAPCQLHSQCQSDGNDPFCIDQFHQNWPGGYCSEYCTVGGSDCPAGSQCSTAFFTGNALGTCLKTCADSTECRSGYFCNFENVCVF